MGDAALLSSEHTGNAHAFLFVANHQVAVVELALHTVEGHKGGVLRQGADNDMIARNGVGIESMQGLPHFHKDKVSHVHHIVDGTYAHSAQFVLQPLRRVGHMDVLKCNSCVSGAEFRLFYGDADSVLASGTRQVGNLWPLYVLVCSVAGVEHSHHIAGYADMACRITAVGGDSHLQRIVFL